MTYVYVFLFLFCLAFICLVIGASDWGYTRWRIWSEKRAIARRDAEETKRQDDLRKWCLLAYPPGPRRIPNAQLDPAHRTGQFSIPRTMRDAKGVHRPLRLPDVRRGTQ